jgi:hypothetical protein
MMILSYTVPLQRLFLRRLPTADFGRAGTTVAEIRWRREVIMTRRIAAGLSILAVVVGVGWKLSTRPETSARLEDISLIQHSEHSHPGPDRTLAGIRIRLTPSDYAFEIRGSEIPEISLVAE